MQKNFKQMQEEPIVMVNGFPIRYDMTLMSYRDLKMMRGNTSLEKWTSSLCTTGGKKNCPTTAEYANYVRNIKHTRKLQAGERQACYFVSLVVM